MFWEVEILQDIYSDSVASDWRISCIISKVISFTGRKMTFVEFYSLTSLFFITDFWQVSFKILNISITSFEIWPYLTTKISYSISFGTFAFGEVLFRLIFQYYNSKNLKCFWNTILRQLTFLVNFNSIFKIILTFF